MDVTLAFVCSTTKILFTKILKSFLSSAVSQLVAKPRLYLVLFFRSLKDSDKAIYQTLVRKNRRGSFNNARRMYEDKINMRKVRQHMQKITILTDEEKLMDMSKVMESQAGKLEITQFLYSLEVSK